jgi:MscS family membrane protein
MGSDVTATGGRPGPVLGRRAHPVYTDAVECERLAIGPGRTRHLAVLLPLLLAVVAPSPAGAAEPQHPLEPPDTFSPRGTLHTFLGSIDEAWERFSARTPDFQGPLRRAVRCLDLSDLPPEVSTELGTEAGLLLKEVLDRLELPPASEIPGPAEVEAEGLRRWTIPHTEIELVKVAEGERQGEFLFSARTVGRLREFYEKVRDLPYQPGKQGGHYDEIRAGALSPVLGPLAARLPAWARIEVGRQLVWQWMVVLVSLVVAVILAALGLRLGRRLGEWEARSSGRRRLAPFVFPVTVIALVALERDVIARFIRLAGGPYYYGRLALSAIADLAIAWLIALAISAVGELAIRHSRAAQRPLDAQLLRLSFRILTVLVVAGYLLLAGESLGLPVPALVAGLGVGGLAVALATQGTLENLIGGLILYADQPVRVGDFFRFGDKMGFVEEIGIRSARIRTLDRTVVAVPNAELVRMQLENFSRRDSIRLQALLRLRMETTPDQLRYLLTRLHRMVLAHPKLSEGGARVRVVALGDYSIDVQLSASARTTDWPEFLAIRQDVLLQALTLVEEAGTRLAVPAHVELEGRDMGLDEGRRHRAEETARRWRAEGSLEVPEYVGAERGGAPPPRDDSEGRESP